MRTAGSALLFASLVAGGTSAPAQALPDGPAFGGSKVFSLGFNPLGNSARFDQAPPGWYLGRVAGDLKSKDHPDALDAMAPVVARLAGT